MKHLLKMLDLSTEEIIGILDLADQLKYELKHGIPHPHLKGKSLGMIFQKASTRTRVSFETGMYQLGGHPLFLSANDLQIGRGEPVQDTARVLSRYLDGIMIRTFEQKEVEDLAGIQDGFCRTEDVLHRRWQQHGKLPHCRLPESRHGGFHRMPG